MARVLSALVLLPIVVGTIWFLSPLATLLLAEVVLLFAFIEYAALCARTGARFPQAPALVAAAVTCAAFGLVPTMALAVLMTATVGLRLRKGIICLIPPDVECEGMTNKAARASDRPSPAFPLFSREKDHATGS